MKPKKQKIGVDEQQLKKIHESYEQLSMNLNGLWDASRAIFPNLRLGELLEMIQTRKNIEAWLSHLYIERNKEKFHGFRADKVLESGLVDLPDFSAIKNLHFQVRNSISGDYRAVDKVFFYFPILGLYDANRDVFTFTSQFLRESEEHCTRYAETEEQKEIYEALQQMLPGLDKLQNHNLLVRPHARFNSVFESLSAVFDHNGDGFEVRHTCFSSPILKHFVTQSHEVNPLERIFE
jgi:hypothetical protein